MEVLDFGAPVVCIERFDRSFDAECPSLDGLPVPRRLHQEDFCQALGIVPERKYESGGGSYLARMAQLIRGYSTRPIDDLQQLWSATVFNFVIGNFDAHLKNFALMRDASWSTLRLAPLYDLVSTACYEGLSTELPFSIGRKRRLEDSCSPRVGRCLASLKSRAPCRLQSSKPPPTSNPRVSLLQRKSQHPSSRACGIASRACSVKHMERRNEAFTLGKHLILSLK